MLLRTRGKLISAGTRLLVVGSVAGLLLVFTGGRAEDGLVATTAAAPPPIRQKYVIQNIVSDGSIGANLSRLKTQFLYEIGNQYGTLDVEPENREWLETEKCKTGQHCDLVTIDVDKRQLVIRCPALGFKYLPDDPAPCPHTRPLRCVANLPGQLPQQLWSHDAIHQKKQR